MSEDQEEDIIPPVVGNKSNLWKRLLLAGFLALLLFVVVAWMTPEKREYTSTPSADRFATGGTPPTIPVEVIAKEPAPKHTIDEDTESSDEAFWASVRSPLIVVNRQNDNPMPQDPNKGRRSLNPYDKLTEAIEGLQEPQGPRPDGNRAFQSSHSDAFIGQSTAYQMEGMHCKLLAGAVIEGVLESAITSTLPGSVIGLVSRDVFAARGRAVMIPRGSKLFGTHNSTVRRGQARIFVVWQRIVTPRGIAVAPGSIATGPLGRAGVGAFVDHHFQERFGNAALISLIGVGASRIGDEIGRAIGDSFSDQASDVLNDSINIPPTLHSDQGDTIQIILQRDLDFCPVYHS